MVLIRLLSLVVNWWCLLLKLDHLLLFPLVNRWQVILNHLVLPIVHCSISLLLLSRVVFIFNVHSSIVWVVYISYFELIELLCKRVWLQILVLWYLCPCLFFFDLLLCILPLNEVVNGILFFQPSLLFVESSRPSTNSEVIISLNWCINILSDTQTLEGLAWGKHTLALTTL